MKYQDRKTQPTYIKREYIQRIKSDDVLAKALAFSLLMKSKVPSSTVKEWNPHKLQKLTSVDGKGGVDPKSIMKYLHKLGEENLIIEMNGKMGKKSLVFKSLKSGVEKKNIEMTYFGFTTLKEAEYYLYSLLFMEEIHHKMWVQQQLYLLHNGFDKEKTKQAKRNCRNYALNRHKGDKFEDWGISFKTIAKKLGVREQKAQAVVNFAINKNLVYKFKQESKEYRPGSYQADKYLLPHEKDYKFVTKDDYVHFVGANTYRIVPNWGVKLKRIQRKHLSSLKKVNRLFEKLGITPKDYTLKEKMDSIVRMTDYLAAKNNKNEQKKEYIDNVLSFHKQKSSFSTILRSSFSALFHTV